MISYFATGNIVLSCIFSFSIIVNFFLAGLFGSAIPILMDKFRFDPSMASPILLTFVTDMFGYLSFLGLAKIFISPA
jgi:magnesium transporter